MRFVYLTFICLVMAGCSAARKSGTATVTFALPSVADLSSSETSSRAEKTGSSTNVLSSDMTAANACLMFDVVADDIPLKNGEACDVPSGIFAGSIAPPANSSSSSSGALSTSTTQMSVPFGEKRTFRVFAYFRHSASESCPKGNSLSDFDRARVAMIGTTSGVSIDKDVVNVDITVKFPKQVLASQFNLPPTCTTTVQVPSVNGGRFTNGSARNAATLENAYQASTSIGRMTDKQFVTTSNGFQVWHKRRANP